MVDFFNELIGCYRLFVQFLFSYSFSGIPVGFIILACMIFMIVVYYILGSVR